jgi:hypothetical protein
MAVNDWVPGQAEEPSLMAKVASKIIRSIPGVGSVAGAVNDVVNYDPVAARMEGSVTNIPVTQPARQPVSRVLRPEVSRAVENAVRRGAAVAPNLLRQNTAVGDAAREALARMQGEPETVQQLNQRPEATITNSTFERKGALDIPVEAVRGAVERMASTAVGATQVGADVLGIEAPFLADEAERLSRQYYNRFEQFDSDIRPYATGVSQFIEQAPTIALAAPWKAAATGGEALTRAAASMIPFAGSVGLPIYAEERAAGEAPIDAANYAIQQTGAEVVPEVLSLGALLRMPLPNFAQIAKANPRAVTEAIKFAGTNLGTQIADEEASTILGFMVDRANDRPGATVEELIPELADTAKSSAAMSALFMGVQGAGYGLSRRRRQEQAPVERDITDEVIEIPEISSDWLPDQQGQTEAQPQATAAPVEEFNIPMPDAEPEAIAIPRPDGDDDVRTDIEIPQAEPEGLQQPRGVRGGAGALEADSGQESGDGAVRQEPRYKPLEGLPARVKVGEQEVEYGPIDAAHDTAKTYVESRGQTYEPLRKYRKVDPERATRIATEFERMEHKPDDPEVKRAYSAMIDETLEQYRAMEKAGVKVEFIPADAPDPYANPRAAIDDIKNNNHLYVFSTKAGFGSDVEFDASQNPMLGDSGIQFNGQPALVNDVFRAVHDYFGHAKDGVGFRADGEENAWRSHARMYSPLARRAMTTETRGQNSWVNYGPAGTRNRTASPSETIYADQKVGLLPEWVSMEGAEDEDADPALNAMEGGTLKLGNRSNKSLDDFMQDLRSSTYANPINGRERVIGEDAIVEVEPFDGGISVKSIRSVEPGKGGGRKALKMLTDMADKYGVKLSLLPKKFGKVGLSTQELKNWYARNGFTKTSSGDMVRTPVPATQQRERDVTQPTSRPNRENASEAQETKDTALSAKSRDYTFSKLERTIESKMANQEPAAALRDKLVGWTNKGDFSADELRFSGLAEWLDEQTGKVTKQQVMDFLAMNNVQVEDVLLTAKPWGNRKNMNSKYMLPAVDTALGKATMETPEALAITLANDREAYMAISKKFPGFIEQDDWAEQVIKDIYGEPSPRVKFSDAKLQLPGGENYKELLLTLPRKQVGLGELKDGESLVDALDRARKENPIYKSSHFPDNPNILAHIRFNERTSADGKRVLFIEEIQSDWAQQGKRKGFAEAPARGLAPGEMKAFLDRARSVAREEVSTRLGLAPEAEDVVNIANGLSNEDVIKFAESREPAIRQEWDGINERQNNDFQAERNNAAVPPAPFVTKTDAWVGLALKRMIRYAAENGFDSVAWTTGEQQADRYDLSKSVKQVIVKKFLPNDANYKLTAYSLTDSKVIDESDVPLDKLDDYIGKDAADKARQQIAEDGSADLRGLDLKVGGSGMRTFYDQIVPKVAKDVIKRIGGDGVKPITFDDTPDGGRLVFRGASEGGTYRDQSDRVTRQQLGFDITPKMRQMALSGEQALMANTVYDDVYVSDATTIFNTGTIPTSLHRHVESTFDAQYEDTFANALADLMEGGMPREAIDMVKGWSMHKVDEAAKGKAYLEYKVISIRKDVVRSAYVGDKKAKAKLRWLIAHEISHLIDGQADNINDMLSANAERFAIDLSDPNDIIAGDIAEEALLHYANGGELANYLAYPLDDAAASIDNAAFLQTELFAQLNALYITNPSALKKNLPMAHEMFEGIYGQTENESATWEQVYSRLQAALSESTTEGIGAGSVARRDVARRTGEAAGQGGNGRGGDTGLNARQGRPRNRVDWEATDPTLWEKIRRALQDKQIDTKAVQIALEDSLGVSLNENVDVYLADDNYYGRQSARIEQFRNQVVTPLVEAMSKAGISIEDVGQFLWARHAPERNRQMASINGGQQGLSGMTNVQAKAIMEEFKLSGKLAKLGKVASVIDRINEQRRKLLVDSGLLTMAESDAWTNTYKYYVPLMRDMEGNMSRGRGFSVSGPESKRAMGSKKAAVGILENVFAQYETTITRAEKNKVAKALYDLAKQYPSEGFWQVDIVPVKKGIDPNSGLVTLYNDPSHKRMDNVVVVKIDGKEHTITFNAENERALAMAKAIKNLDAVQLHALLQTLGSVTRFLASMLTTYNPAFWMTNFQRDAQTAIVNLQNTPLAGMSPQVMKNVPLAMRGIWKGVNRKFDTVWAKHYREFEMAGGKTGWSQIFEDVRARNKDLAKTMERATRSDFDPREVANKFLETVRNLNDAVENSIRLSAYVEARKKGLSEAKAAALAKNLTVNFNRKGNQAWINALYMFFNANVQGTARLAQALVQSRKAQAIVASMVIFSFLNDMFNRWVDEDAWETLDETVKRRNLIFITGEGTNKYVSIPLPYGYDVFHNAGRKIAEAFFSPNFKPAQAATDYLITVVDAFSPLGQSGSLAQYIAPTVIDPFVQVSENKTSFGSPLMPEQSQFSIKPDYQRYWSSTPSIFVQTAKDFSDITGGDDVQGGSVDVSPEVLQLMFDTVTGGVGKLGSQLVEAGTRAATGRPIKVSQTPFLNRNAGEIDDRKVAQRFYKLRDDVQKFESDIAAYRKARKFAEMRELMEKEPGLLAASRTLKANKIRQKNLSRDRKELVNMGYGEKLDARDALDERQADIARKVIEAYNKGNSGR